MRDIWEEEAANDLKALIKRAGLGYAELVELLSAEGLEMTAPALTKKLHRGAFSHAFYLQCAEILRRHAHGRSSSRG